MKNSRLKSLLLLVLVLNSIFLTTGIWFNEKLWPFGYNFFLTLKNNSVIKTVSNVMPDWIKGSKVYESGFHDIYTPRLLVVKSGSLRTQFRSKDSQFMDLYPEISKAMENLYISGNIISSSDSSKEEWLTALKGRSVYIDFGIPVSSKLYGLFLAKKEAEIQGIQSFSKVILSLQSDAENELVVYINSGESEKYKKFILDHNKTSIVEKITSLVNENSPSYKFAFELRLDTQDPSNNQGILKRVQPSSLVLFPQQDISIPNLLTKPVMGERSDIYTAEILKIFKYNTLAFRKLEDVYSNVLYVENFSTLKFTNDNFLVYKAVDSEKGLLLKDSSEFSLAQQYEIISSATAFVGELWNTLYNESPNMELRLSSPLIENSDGKYNLTFDYYYDGIPITIENASAISLQIENGRIVSYTQKLITFEKQEGFITSHPVLWAIDEFYKTHLNEFGEAGGKIVTIKDIFLRYAVLGGKITANWSVKTDDNLVYTVNENI